MKGRSERKAYRFCSRYRIDSRCSAHSRKRLEEVVREHVDSLRVREEESKLASCVAVSRQRGFSGAGNFLETHPVVRLQIVDLFPEHQRPQVLADEFDHVERVVEPRPVAREPGYAPNELLACVSLSPWHVLVHKIGEGENIPLHKPLPNTISQRLQSVKHRIPLFLLVHRSRWCRRRSAATASPLRGGWIWQLRFYGCTERRAHHRRRHGIWRCRGCAGRRCCGRGRRWGWGVGGGGGGFELVGYAVGHGYELDQQEV